MNKLFSEEWAVVGVIDPDLTFAGTQLTAAIDMSKWEQLAAIVILGDRGANGVIDFAFHSSSTSGGSYAAISGKAITQVTATSPLANSSNKQYIVNLRGSEVTDNNQYVKGSLTVASASSPQQPSDITVLVVGRARYLPADDNDISSVAEIVA